MGLDPFPSWLRKRLQHYAKWIPDQHGRRHWHNVCAVHPLWSLLPCELQHAICGYLVVKFFPLAMQLHIWIPIYEGYFLNSMQTINYVTGNPVKSPKTPSKKERKKSITNKWQRRQQQWEKQNKRWK